MANWKQFFQLKDEDLNYVFAINLKGLSKRLKFHEDLMKLFEN